MNANCQESTSESQARAQLRWIVEMMETWLRLASDDDAADGVNESYQALFDNVLDLQIRSGWHTPGADASPGQYMLLLCTGGPAVRITGDLNQFGEAETVRIEHQDWGTKWETLLVSNEEQDIIDEYTRGFYFHDSSYANA